MPPLTEPAEVLVRLIAREVIERLLPRQLERLMVSAVGVLGVSGAAVMLLDQLGALQAFGASDPTGTALEEAQTRLGLGPSVDAARSGAAVAVDDLLSDRRYPALAELLTGAAVKSVLSVPVLIRGQVIGNLNAYRNRPGPWSERDRRAAAAYAELIGLLLRLGLETYRRSGLSFRQPA
jgi:GAF domain-containing protein